MPEYTGYDPSLSPDMNLVVQAAILLGKSAMVLEVTQASGYRGWGDDLQKDLRKYNEAKDRLTDLVRKMIKGPSA